MMGVDNTMNLSLEHMNEFLDSYEKYLDDMSPEEFIRKYEEGMNEVRETWVDIVDIEMFRYVLKACPKTCSVCPGVYKEFDGRLACGVMPIFFEPRIILNPETERADFCPANRHIKEDQSESQCDKCLTGGGGWTFQMERKEKSDGTIGI